MKRREFIILSSVGATSASLLSACGHPEEKLIPALIPDDEYVPGVDYWKASTCGMCPAGCGIIVRTREHKANKIEGNPLHPVNRGALCARGQAGLEVLYNPDRIKGPMKRIGERGEGKWQEITWDEGIKTLADRLREIDPNSSTEKALFVTADSEGVTAYVAGRFMQAYRQAFLAQRSHGPNQLRGIYADLLRGVVKSREAIPDIANATYLLSFGARFLETWRSPVMYSQAYGEFRSSRGKPRGRFVHVEPRMSLTAANADEWVAAAPGTEALVALAMVQVMVREGLNKAPVTADSTRKLEEFTPERTALVTDVPAERIIRLAREFSRAERPLAIGDLRSPDDSEINLLNAIVENLNKPGGVLLVESQDKPDGLLQSPGRGLILPGESDDKLETPGPRDSVERISRFFQMVQHPYRVMMVHGFSRMFTRQNEREELLATTPFIVSFSSCIDATSDVADLILPDHTYLERWDLHTTYGPDGGRVISLTQPALEPQLNTRQTADVLIAVAREMGGEVAEALPFESAKEIIEKGAVDLLKHDPSESTGAAWRDLTEKGLVSAGSPASLKPQAAEQKPMSLDTYLLGTLRRSASDGATNAEYSLTLILYDHQALGFGEQANLPALQELPDPMTSVMWGSWVEINPKTASSLGIADGDLVEVSTEHGSLRVPAVFYPAIRPDVIAMPFGQGHTHYGRYATNRGANPAVLNPALHGPVRARVSKVEGKTKLIRFGTQLQERMEKRG